MEIIFKKKYVNYSEISDIKLVDINDVLLDNDIFLELGDNYCNDWAGYSYYYCKLWNELDEETISSFVYVITWIMTGNPIDICPNFKSDTYYKNGKIINKCLNIYNYLLGKHDSEISLCSDLFRNIYDFYKTSHEKYTKKTERVNFVLSYYELRLFEKVDGDNRSDKMRNLLNNYFNLKD